MTENHEPIAPETAKEMYLDERRQELAESTLQSHHFRLKQFVLWCDEECIDTVNELSGRDIQRYRVERRDEDELTTASMKGQLATLRQSLRFCATIDAVQPGLDEKIILPKPSDTNARDELLTPEQAREVFAYLEKFRYATLEHALLAVLWHASLRTGAAIGLDIDDYDADEQHLRLVHRPGEETPSRTGRAVNGSSR